MGSRGRKSAAKLAKRKAAQPSETRTQAGHVHKVPGSQNIKKG